MPNVQTMTRKEVINRNQEINARLRELSNMCVHRERNEAEEAEYQELCREQGLLQIRMSELACEQMSRTLGVAEPRDMDMQLREILDRRQPAIIQLQARATQTSAALDGTGIIPTSQEEMLKPLRSGLIWNKVGINVRSGLRGTLRWPNHTKAVAQWADEAEALIDKSIDFSKLEMTGERMGIMIPVTKTELYESGGIVEGVIREEMPNSIRDLINAAMFTTVGTYMDGAQTKNKKVVGPLVEAKASNSVAFAADVPTRKELLKMVRKPLDAGIDCAHGCWVLNGSMAVELMDTKVDAGSGRFLLEGGYMLGYPVFITNAIEAGNIAFGDWSYQPAGFFGPMDLVVDPYTAAQNWATRFVLNGRFGTATLRPEAFTVGFHA